jgi:hypothetical protein
MITLHGNGLMVSVTPESGGRITQLTDRQGQRWLVETDRREPAFAGGVAVDFAAGTRGGWDECLPSVSACVHPDTAVAVADHGDYWWRPWQIIALADDQLILEPAHVDGPLRVRKTITVSGELATVQVGIRVTNVGATDYRFLYSAHPLWRWDGDARLDLPGATETRMAFGRPAATGTWPMSGARFEPSGVPENYKMFVRWDGCAVLSFAGRTGALVLTQAGAATPWLGVCVNRDHWPADCPGESWIALEPTTSPTDSLVDAVADGSAYRLGGGQSLEWNSTIEIRGLAA